MFLRLLARRRRLDARRRRGSAARGRRGIARAASRSRDATAAARDEPELVSTVLASSARARAPGSVDRVPVRHLVVLDIDITVAVGGGSAAAVVDRFGHAQGSPTSRARTLDALVPARAWRWAE
jgi:hypothetical protein